MSNTKHTPTPWKLAGFRGDILDGKKELLATAFPMNVGGDDSQTANAAFIVRAVNSHEQLLQSLRAGRVAIDVLMAQLIECDPSFKPTTSAVWPALVAIKNALAAAEA